MDKRYLIGAAILALAAPAAAQDPRESEPPPGHQRKESIEFPPGTPEALRRKVLESIEKGEGRTVAPVFAELRLIERVGFGSSVPVEPSPMIAGETYALLRESWVTEAEIVIPKSFALRRGSMDGGKPQRLRFPAGTPVTATRQGGALVHCLDFGRRFFAPAVDRAGNIYPGMCLLDGDGDGAFDRMRFEPYRPREASPQETAIAPIRLNPVPLAEREPEQVFHRRLAIAAATQDAATVRLEHFSDNAFGPGSKPLLSPQTAVLPLKDGAVAELGGAGLRVEKHGTGWRIAISGAFPTWVALTEDRTAWTVGPSAAKAKAAPPPAP